MDTAIQTTTAAERIYDSVCLIPGQTAKQLADYLEMPYNTVTSKLSKLKNAGKLRNDEAGRWYELRNVGYNLVPQYKPAVRAYDHVWEYDAAIERSLWVGAFMIAGVLGYVLGRYV